MVRRLMFVPAAVPVTVGQRLPSGVLFPRSPGFLRFPRRMYQPSDKGDILLTKGRLLWL